jgi:hypothetical protein
MMEEGRTVFTQLLDYFPRYEFDKCVSRHGGMHGVKRFSCFDQFLCMAFAQLTGRESLRDTETCLRSFGRKLYHAGFRGHVSRSTLSDANEARSWEIYGDIAQILIAEARHLYVDEPFALELDNTVYALDSTTIDLCLNLFPWAKFRKRKGAVKMHTLLDLRGNIPAQIIVTHGKVHDVRALDALIIEAGAIYIMDRAYIDFIRLFRLERERAFFVTRAKSNMDFIRVRSRAVDKSTGVRCDQTVALAGNKSVQDYPVPLRRIRFRDPETGRQLVFLTNHFDLPPEIVAALYKQRWHVELFFKWIKQHLRIKAFFGTSENAVKTQLWIAVCVYLLAAIVRKRLGIDTSLYQMLQILSLSLFEKIPLKQLLTQNMPQIQNHEIDNQLNLFGD